MEFNVYGYVWDDMFDGWYKIEKNLWEVPQLLDVSGILKAIYTHMDF